MDEQQNMDHATKPSWSIMRKCQFFAMIFGAIITLAVTISLGMGWSFGLDPHGGLSNDLVGLCILVAYPTIRLIGMNPPISFLLYSVVELFLNVFLSFIIGTIIGAAFSMHKNTAKKGDL